MGRPRLEFDPERADLVLANLRAGDLLDVACRRAGVSWSTVRRWRLSRPGFDWMVRVESRRALAGGSLDLAAEVFSEKERIKRGMQRRPWADVEAVLAEREQRARDRRPDARPDPTAEFGSTFDPTRPETAF